MRRPLSKAERSATERPQVQKKRGSKLQTTPKPELSHKALSTLPAGGDASPRPESFAGGKALRTLERAIAGGGARNTPSLAERFVTPLALGRRAPPGWEGGFRATGRCRACPQRAPAGQIPGKEDARRRHCGSVAPNWSGTKCEVRQWQSRNHVAPDLAQTASLPQHNSETI